MKLRYYGSQQLHSGYGRAALELITALALADVELDLRTVGPARDGWWVPHELGGFLNPIEQPDAVIVHTLPGDCARVLELEGLKRGRFMSDYPHPVLVAYTTWESLEMPPAIARPLAAGFDQVWVPSSANAAAMPLGGVQVVPHCFNDAIAPMPSWPPEPHDRFRFYWVGAWTARKNPQGLIRAFAHAFPAESGAELVLHSPGTTLDTFAAALAATGLTQDELPSITLSNEHLSDVALARLHATSDCFVTAARGEAWNLPAFDAMLAGRHVIAQHGLGSDEFLLKTSAELVDGIEAPALVDVAVKQLGDGSVTFRTPSAQGLSARCLWLEPNLHELADAMRRAYAARNRTIEISYDVAARFGYAAVAKHALNLLEDL